MFDDAIVLAIKPEFAEKIFSGEKKFEFRRTIFKREDIRRVVVYASAPISKVIGEFEIDGFLMLDLADLWKKTKSFSGISKKYFLEYFEGKEHGYAIKVKKINRYDEPLCIESCFGIKAPQSFAYI